jgi:preprotein translocase subunit SecD
MNRYPLWKYLLVLFVLGLGCLYALPNLYPADPAVQISGTSGAVQIDERVLQQATGVLDRAGIDYIDAEIGEGNLLVRLRDREHQLPAKEAIAGILGEDYVVALNMAATTPDWLRSIGAGPMKLGLDLAGGVHFLLEVDTAEAVATRMASMEDVLRRAIRQARIRDVDVRLVNERYLEVTAPSEALRNQVADLVREELPELQRSTGQNGEGRFWLRAQMSEQAISDIESYAVSQNLTTLRNRVNELGVSEPLVQRQGANRIVVELPGVQDTAAAKRIIGKTANLEFRLQAQPDELASQKEEFEWLDPENQRARGSVYLERRVIVTGDRVTDAKVGFDPETSMPQVNITLDSEGGASMHRATRNNVGRPLGVLFIEYKTRIATVTNEDGEQVETTVQVPEKKIISLATIQSALGRSFRTTGLDQQEASELALLLRSGALAAPMVFVQERTIGPSLGAENIKLGVTSVQIGLALVLIFMLVYYKVFGIAANLALAANLVLLVAAMSFLGATLTLPGIAGIVLTVGMAVDANVLIFSRIREELKANMPPQTAIKRGYEHAFSTILDANVTTLIVAVILFAIGSGPVKGFAVTLSIGILTSMFTAIIGTRAFINLIYGGRSRVSKVWI